ncbi:hypothetical protein [Bacillus sp. UMB0893]|uniref:hypothetical protein n=1 Tax=Bacillus sp. UMB0893 TaxID=2066053 RepID=UPI000C75D9F1|nr:hypothetical protein [Bacillus sp. UMB0893]PLR69112.1 hypothetical protein CYJ36_01230 [Bacillus sp. UMB0893]
MDIKIWSVFVSATVALITFLVLHFFIEPMKEEKKRKLEQYKNFYAPLYTIVITRASIVKEYSLKQNRMMLGHTDKKPHLQPDFMEEFIIKNSGYASVNLIDAFKDLASTKGAIDKDISERFTKTVVIDYNKLKKGLKMEYNKEELLTGIPEILKEFRTS